MPAKRAVVLYSQRALLAELLVPWLSNQSAVGPVAVALQAADVRSLAKRRRGAIYFLDPGHSGEDAFGLAEHVRRTDRRARIVFLADAVAEGWIRRALDLGADGFIGPDAGLQELRHAIRSLAADQNYYSPSAATIIARLAAPYFACAAEWYETVGIGVTGGEIDALVKRHLGDPFFGVGLNPGHLIHLDEWMNTPIWPDSTERLQSGQAIQLDIIPVTGPPWFTSNIEDGIALLDARGRAGFAERYPAAWSRIEARRAFMADVLGIRLKPEVLPFSNLAGWLPPFLLAPGRGLALR